MEQTFTIAELKDKINDYLVYREEAYGLPHDFPNINSAELYFDNFSKWLETGSDARD